jgi:hypothetical protein
MEVSDNHLTHSTVVSLGFSTGFPEGWLGILPDGLLDYLCSENGLLAGKTDAKNPSLHIATYGLYEKSVI